MLRTLAGSLRQYRAPSLLTVFLMGGEVFLEILIPVTMAKLIDLGIGPGSMDAVLRYGLILLLFALLQMAAGILAAFASSRAAAGFAANLRQDMFDRVQTFAFLNLDKFSTASIVTRLTTDVANLQMAYQMAIRMMVRAPLMLVLAVIFSFRINVRIACVFLFAIPFLGCGLYLVIRKVRPMYRKVFATYDKLNAVVRENLRGIRVVKSFDREDFEIGKFREISDRIYRIFSRAEQLAILIFPLMMFCAYACVIAVSWLGAHEIVASGNDPALGLTLGQLTALFSYQMQILMSLMMLGMIFAMLTMSQASGERVAELLCEESAMAEQDAPLPAPKDGSIRFEHVSFAYSAKADKKVLRDIHLEIASGETVGILGGTGAAKTSLVQLIPRLYDVSEGSVCVGGEDVRSYGLDALRRSVAMVLQKNELFSGTVAENLRWGNENATQEELEAACRLAAAHDFITALPQGYETLLDQGGTNVSGGQKQRLCIARALLKHPKVLILDDSTSAVDTRTDSLISEALSASLPETTKLIIAQRVSSVRHADKIILMDDGEILDMGRHETLLQRSAVYREIYESQQRGGDELAP